MTRRLLFAAALGLGLASVRAAVEGRRQLQGTAGTCVFVERVSGKALAPGQSEVSLRRHRLVPDTGG
ncbi:unnamed protein product [Pylaiella littoralis]